jgi:hypothetical protein
MIPVRSSLPQLPRFKWGMPQLTQRPTKIAFAERRESGVRGLLIYCADYRCSHSVAISGDRWPDHVRLSDIEPQFVCQACGNQRSYSGKVNVTQAITPTASSAVASHGRDFALGFSPFI